MHFGFLTDDMERVLPTLVRSDHSSTYKALVYQDLIAVLTAALQTQQRQIEELQRHCKGTANKATAEEPCEVVCNII